MKNKRKEKDKYNDDLNQNKKFFIPSTFPSRIETIPHIQERYPPLTFARLEKKNKLDQLLIKKRKSKIERRYTIANGYINQALPHYLYNDMNDDHCHSSSSSKSTSECSIKVNNNTLKRSTNDSKDDHLLLLTSKRTETASSKTTSFLSTTEPSFNIHHLSIDRKIKSNASISTTFRKKLNEKNMDHHTVSRFLNSNNFLYYLKKKKIDDHNFYFSSTSPKNIKNIGLSYYQLFFQQIKTGLNNLVDRVINTRGCESLPINLSVNEIIALSRFLCAIRLETRLNKKEEDNNKININNNNSNSNESFYQVFQDEQNDLFSRSLKMNDLLSEKSPLYQQKKLCKSDNSLSVASTSSLHSFSKQSQEQQQQKSISYPSLNRHLSSLTHNCNNNNTPQYTFLNQTNANIETNHIFKKSLIIFNNLIQYMISFFTNKIASFFKYLMADSTEYIQFDGWSLWLFSPKSNIRFYLWTIIASR